MITRLVDFQEYDPPPEDILRHLREIDYRAELVNVRPGHWWAGIVKPFAERVARGKRELLRLEKDGRKKGNPLDWPKIRNALLASQGFGCVCKHRFGLGKVEWSLLVEDFRYRCWWYLQYQEGDQDVRKEIEGLLDEDITAKARAAVVESMQADGRYLFKRVVREDPRPVTVGAQIQ